MFQIMTSQVILMNASGVGIASDSAMTFGNRRVYDTAEKIFPLPAPHCVAILHSGAVFLQDYTYQGLISEWAKSLGSVQLRTVDLYQQNFLDWLTDNVNWFSNSKQLEWARQILDDRLNFLWRRCRDKSNEGVTTATEIERVISSITDDLRNYPPNFGPQLQWLNYVMKEQQNYLNEQIDYWFDDVPFRDETKELLLEDIRVFLEKGLFKDEAKLAFCGFGSNEIMPSYSTTVIRGVLGNIIIGLLTEAYQYDPHASWRHYAIIPLGQTKTIHEFLRGVESGMVDLVYQAVFDSVTETLETVKGHLGENYEQTLNGLHSKFQDVVKTRIDEQVSRRTDKIAHVLPALPAVSLASYAGSLIDLVALRLSIDGEMNTVGGPIDTAMITRENGFRWVHHKSIG